MMGRIHTRLLAATTIAALGVGLACTPHRAQAMNAEGVRLEFSDGRPALTSVVDINSSLAEAGVGVWPLDLRNVPEDIRSFLQQPVLTEAEAARLQEHFLLSRGRLLQIIRKAGREPNVPGGGALSTFVSNEGYSYQQLWVVVGGVDYTRFDRFHVNVSADGTGVDEVLQMLSGAGVVVKLRLPSGSILALRLACPTENAGWTITYNGGKPHIGSLSGATPGTKVFVQAIGPPSWALTYQ